MLFKFSSEFSKYQIYQHIPKGQWQVLALNVKQVQKRILFDLLLADLGSDTVIPVLLNELSKGNKQDYPLEDANLSKTDLYLIIASPKDLRQPNQTEINNLAMAKPRHLRTLFVAHNNELTSIVIPCYNQLEYTKLCVASIFEHTQEPFELILVNNASEDGTQEYLNELESEHNTIRVINNSSNLGFGAACNQGMALAKGDFVLILNNDVVVTSGWLTRMLKVANSDKGIGMVGPRSNRVAGVQLIKDVPYQDLKGMHEFAAELTAKYATSNFEINRIIGLCMLIKREVVELIGGFDPIFGVGNYEDDDYCIRTRIAGYKIVVCNSVFIHHFGSQTFIGAKINYEELIKKNWAKFMDKWAISQEQNQSMSYNPNEIIKQPFNSELHYCPLVTVEG